MSKTNTKTQTSQSISVFDELLPLFTKNLENSMINGVIKVKRRQGLVIPDMVGKEFAELATKMGHFHTVFEPLNKNITETVVSHTGLPFF